MVLYNCHIYLIPFLHDTVVVADVIIYFLAVFVFVVTCTSEWTQSEKVCLSYSNGVHYVILCSL